MILCSDRGTKPLFKMIISNPAISLTKAKTISTLEHCLDLSQYDRIIILDDDGPNSWCRHEMIRKSEITQTQFMLIKVPELSVWRSVHRQFLIHAAKRDLPQSEGGIAQFLFSMVTSFQNRDQFFVHFHEFLHALHQNNSRIFRKYMVRMLPVSGNGAVNWGSSVSGSGGICWNAWPNK